MTYPSPPSEMVDFNAGRPVPDHDIGRQFAEQARSIRTIIMFLESCFRADGRLKNSTIGREQLDPDIAGELSSRALSALGSLLTRVEDLANEAVLAKIDAQNARDRAEACLERVSRLENAGRRRGEEVLSRLDEREAFELAAAPQTFAAAIAPMSASGNGNGDYLGAPGLVSNRTVLDASVYGAEQWAEVSLQWAEHLPDTIPPNILAMNAITGQHWSSRWWAIRAAGAFGMLAWYYAGASDEPPASTLTGDPLSVGVLWFNTNTNTMMVWNGASWQPFERPQKAFTLSLYYVATDSQNVFPLTTLDLYGNSYSLNQLDTEGIEAFLNGVRLTPDLSLSFPTGDYYVDAPSSSITFGHPLRAGDVVAIDVLQTASQLSPGAVAIYSLNSINTPPGTQDGTRTSFQLTLKADGTAPILAGAEELVVSLDGVIQEPGVQYTAMGDTIAFAQAPSPDAYVFILWYKSPVNNP